MTQDYSTPTSATARPRRRFLSVVKKILLVLVILIGIFCIIVALQPAEYKVTRSATINGTPAAVFPHVNDFHKWQAWSPWAKLDPKAKNTFDGAPEGTGAIFAWSGDDKVGEGKMTITQSKPNELIWIKLEFVRPFADTCDTEFSFKPQGDGKTLVTWSMAGHKNFISKAVCMFMDMDKMLGGDFEKGLSQMNTAVEAEKNAQSRPVNETQE